MRSRRLLRVLVGYYGALQAGHILLILWVGLQYARSGQIGFPAQPPVGGWPAASIPWLVGNGALDLLVAGAGMVFALRFFRGGQGWFHWGVASLAGALYSAGIFGAGTLPSGAWAMHPLAYGLLALLFAPILPCLFVVITARPERTA